MNGYQEKLKAEHGESVIYEDRGVIDMETVHVDSQPCRAVDFMLTPICKQVGAYRIFGWYKDKGKGARGKRFDRNLCAEHLAAWAKLHGTTVEALLNRSADE